MIRSLNVAKDGLSGPHAATAPEYGRSRSTTAIDKFRLLKRSVTPNSAPPHPVMSAVTASQTSLPSTISPDLNTLPDPRAPSPAASMGTRTPSNENGHHPDLSSEVATLTTKLINAINHQTSLDDALQETKHELDTARERLAQLEAADQEHQYALSGGVLIHRDEAHKVEEGLRKVIADERKRRHAAERDKKGMEQELETLTSQLFEEANGMVASARHDKEATDRKMQQLLTQLKESEVLLASQQEQLQDLKNTMQQAQPEEFPRSRAGTTPSTPVTSNSESIKTTSFELPGHTRNHPSTQSLHPPESPLHFTNLIHPIVRTDNQAYEDFVSLLRENKGGSPPSRASSGNFSGLNVLGIGSSKDLSQSQSTVVPSSQGPMNSSSRSTSVQNTPNPAAVSPNPASVESYANSAPMTLKDTKYFKRALVEDIEPTLRLDTAPGLSWLARRTALNCIASGQLLVEPYPPKHAFHSPAFGCALCGETRTGDEYIRKYRFKTSDSDEAQRYPICDYCLTRVRTVCDFTGFLRLARRGQWKNETVEECKIAWEECVRLREKMFWSRLGGGVVPVNGSVFESPSPQPLTEPSKASSEIRSSGSDLELPSIARSRSQQFSRVEERSQHQGQKHSLQSQSSHTEDHVRTGSRSSAFSHDMKVENNDQETLKKASHSAQPSFASTGSGALERFPEPPEKEEASELTSRGSPGPEESASSAVLEANDRPPSSSSAIERTPTMPNFESHVSSEAESVQSDSRPASKAGRSLTQSSTSSTAERVPPPLYTDSRPITGTYRRFSEQRPDSERSASASRRTRDSQSPGPLNATRLRSSSSAPRRNTKVAAMASKFQEHSAGTSSEGSNGAAGAPAVPSAPSSSRSPEKKAETSPSRTGLSQSPKRRGSEDPGSKIPGSFG